MQSSFGGTVKVKAYQLSRGAATQGAEGISGKGRRTVQRDSATSEDYSNHYGLKAYIRHQLVAAAHVVCGVAEQGHPHA